MPHVTNRASLKRQKMPGGADDHIPAARGSGRDDGFSLALDSMAAEHLRGRVDLYDGPRLVSQCLVIACEAQGHEIRFEYKRMTGASEEQPVDFVRHAPAPAGLLTCD